MAIKRKIEIGSILKNVGAGTIFADMDVSASGRQMFSRHLSKIGKGSAELLKKLHEDLEKNKNTLNFLEKREIEIIYKIAEQFSDVARFLKVSTSKDKSSIKNVLEQAQRMPRLESGANSNMNKGSNYQKLASEAYSKELITKFLGENFWKLHRGNYSLKLETWIKDYCRTIINRATDDVKRRNSSNEEMDEEAYERISEIFNDLANFVNISINEIHKLSETLNEFRKREKANSKNIRITYGDGFKNVIHEQGIAFRVESTVNGKVFTYRIDDNGFIEFNFEENDYASVFWSDLKKGTLARAMIAAAREIDPTYLSGRTVLGVVAELDAHYIPAGPLAPVIHAWDNLFSEGKYGVYYDAVKADIGGTDIDLNAQGFERIAVLKFGYTKKHVLLRHAK